MTQNRISLALISCLLAACGGGGGGRASGTSTTPAVGGTAQTPSSQNRPAHIVSLDGYRNRFDAPGQTATVRYLLIDVTSKDWDGDGRPDHDPLEPKAIIVVLPGGDGGPLMNPRGGEVGTRLFPDSTMTRYQLAAEGFVVALVGRASDFAAHNHPQVVAGPPSNPRFYYDSHRSGLVGHTLPGQVYAELYLQDLGAVFADLRARFRGLPLWVLGYSNGAVNAISAAIALDHPPDGLVLASPDVTTHPFNNIYLRRLERVNVPILVMRHQDDGCNRDRRLPNAIGSYAGAFPASPNVQTVLFSGGDPGAGGDPCTAPGPHYFLGIEEKVVATLSRWIKDQVGIIRN